MNNNSGISTLTMGAEVILGCPKFISTVTLQTKGEQEQRALCRVENIRWKKNWKQYIYIYKSRKEKRFQVALEIAYCTIRMYYMIYGIPKFYSLVFESYLCSFCSSELNIQQIGLSSRIIMNIWSFNEHVFEQRRQQVLCQFVHKQCYKITSVTPLLTNFKIKIM